MLFPFRKLFLENILNMNFYDCNRQKTNCHLKNASEKFSRAINLAAKERFNSLVTWKSLDKVVAKVVLVSVVFIGLSACSGKKEVYTMTLTSTAFKDGETIPAKYVCKYDKTDYGISPQLSWSGTPTGTVALALSMIDVGAGHVVHWIVGGFDPKTQQLAEGYSPSNKLPPEIWQLESFHKKYEYAGPCPPANGPHRYVFTIYALDAVKKPADFKAFREYVDRHTLAKGKLTGVFEKQ